MASMKSIETKFTPDIDFIETQEWLDSLASVVHFQDLERAAYLVQKMFEALKRSGYEKNFCTNTNYQNTLPSNHDSLMPDDGDVVEKTSAIIKWNAVATVMKAGKIASELGGHISTYASISNMYEVGFDHFFHANSLSKSGDLVYFQGHSSPGIYARAFIEGRITETELCNFRQEVGGNGLSSYPHPWLMPDFWQFPTVSMGLGAIQAIYQARFLSYLDDRNLTDTSGRNVWCFCGDGEMDEPESLGALSIAAREKLDNLIFVINCNMQRLDGPVRGNGKIVQELESIFSGAGWFVIKVLWDSAWDKIFAIDKNGYVSQRLAAIVDGDMQNFGAADVSTRRMMLFSGIDELESISKQLSDDDIANLGFGGHDRKKIYAAYTKAVDHKEQPVVILAHSIKGNGLGNTTAGMNIAHNQKKLSDEDLLQLRDHLSLPLSDEEAKSLSFIKPSDSDNATLYLREKRAALGGYFPQRHHASFTLNTPDLDFFQAVLAGSSDREISTTMAFVRVLSLLLRDNEIKNRIVPIVPDESRTFGMEGLFRQIGIYSQSGQNYTPVDKSQIMYYKESKTGQLLQEGINEAGAFSSWIAAATSYSNNNYPMIPFYIFYSMFGFQRIGDLAWAAADSRARGFLLGATSGRTTLAGEGLQHTDGHSHVMSSLVPNCISYDPAFGYEVAVIIQHGLRHMFVDNADVYYYITLTNDNYIHPEIVPDSAAGIIKGMYKYSSYGDKIGADIVLLSCGAIFLETLAAAKLLQQDFAISSDVWSVTSFTELKRDAERVSHSNLHNPHQDAVLPFVTQSLQYHSGPIVAATDYVRTFAEQIRPYINNDYHVLGTDGFGLSDTRKQMRHHFEVDAKHIAYMAIYALAKNNVIDKSILYDAYTKYNIDANKQYSLDM